MVEASEHWIFKRAYIIFIYIHILVMKSYPPLARLNGLTGPWPLCSMPLVLPSAPESLDHSIFVACKLHGSLPNENSPFMSRSSTKGTKNDHFLRCFHLWILGLPAPEVADANLHTEVATAAASHTGSVVKLQGWRKVISDGC